MKHKDLLEQLDRSRLLRGLILLFLFALMLLCNSKTCMVADDYAYCFSFADGQPVESLGDCVRSMAAHRQWMNGRVIAHFLVQLFLMLPPALFKILNSLVFVTVLCLLARIAGREEGRSNLLLMGLFGCVWIFMPSFGQVILWLDGSVNYLWSALFSLGMLIVYVDKFMYDRDLPGLWRWVFPAAAFLTGAYSEPSATAVIFCCALLTLMGSLLNRQRPRAYLLLALASAFAGFLFMILAPGELLNKAGRMSMSGLTFGLVNAMELYRQIWLLLVLYLAFAILAWQEGVELRRQLLALTLMLGSLAAIFVLAFAGYAEDRCACFGMLLIAGASGVLFPAVYKSRFRPALYFGLAVCMIVTLYWGCVGLQDICESCAQQKRNEQVILSARESGLRELALSPVSYGTKYSAGAGLVYLTPDRDSWVNSAMARYYGLDSLVLDETP